jgi:uncharacterized protein YfdQ (DUF2303 family)
MINWYNEVSRNLSKIPDCVAYYDAELLEAKKQCKVYGNLERDSASLPGIVEERFSQLQHLEAILEYLNIELRRLRSKTFRKFLENYNKLLSSRDAEKYVDGEDDVVDMTKIINDFALIRNQWLGITKGLDQKQWQITNIVKLRVAGMEDADIG